MKVINDAAPDDLETIDLKVIDEALQIRSKRGKLARAFSARLRIRPSA